MFLQKERHKHRCQEPEEKCGICFEPFSMFNDPKRLPCSHVFCCDCLKDWATICFNGIGINCPLCRKAVPIPSEGVEGFPVEFRRQTNSVNMIQKQVKNIPKEDSSTTEVGMQVKFGQKNP